jgi:putative membrane protein
MTQSSEPRGRISDHLANERTHLAYVRTAVALLAFGITLHQFSWFMGEHNNSTHPGAFATGWRVGFGMVLLGIGLALWSAIRFEQITRQIDAGTYHPSRKAMWLLSLGIITLGAAGAGWLFWMY